MAHIVRVTFGDNKTAGWDMDVLRKQLNILTTRLAAEPSQEDEDVVLLWGLAEALDDEVHAYFMAVDDEEDT